MTMRVIVRNLLTLLGLLLVSWIAVVVLVLAAVKTLGLVILVGCLAVGALAGLSGRPR